MIEDIFQEELKQLSQELTTISISDEKALEEYRLTYLTAQGKVKKIISSFSQLQPIEKRKYGKAVNTLKADFEAKYQSLKQKFGTNEKKKKNVQDWSLPAEHFNRGSYHPIVATKKQICNIFKKVGFRVAQGPEIEDDWHNFEALNILKHHPARDMQDTFFVNQNPDYVLRTHTSNTQIREMKKGKLPIQIVCPGLVFRNETVSARSHYFFHQIEGLVVNTDVSFQDLKTILYYFVTNFFGENVKVRFRPSYFPFTEPSAEMDITCLVCQGTKCNVCKHTGWLEILGCGMVHPKVLENCNIDNNTYSGYAFGMGIERIAMLKYKVNDLRLFSQNNISFLKQF